MPEPRSIGPVKPSASARSGRHHADADRALLPDAVVGEQRLVVVDVLREALGEVLDEVEQRALAVLVQLADRLLVADTSTAWYCGIASGRSR